MPPFNEHEKLHSAEYFGEQRDHWWNQDYLALVAQRLKLGRAHRVLDVGSGVGHWGRAILPHLDASAQIVGVDREPEWVKIASQVAASRGLGGRMRYVLGEAERMPFTNGAFDLVTCQTLLMHVRDYQAVVREMLRLLSPGGRLLIVEPNNLAGMLLFPSKGTREELEDRLRLVRFQAICEHGKEQLGEGNNSIGDRLPGFLAELGVTGLEVCQSDHAYPMVPPYATPAQRALRAQMLDWAERGFWIWNEHDTRRFFIAGGGREEEFVVMWPAAMKSVQREADELRRGTYHAAGGSVVYLVSAQMPG